MINEYKILIGHQEKVVQKLTKMVNIGSQQLKIEQEALNSFKEKLKKLEEEQ